MAKSFIDSAYPPNDAQLEAAVAHGHSGWNGYFAGPNILNGWAKADFDRVKRHGLATMAYCSGWSPALAMRAQSAAWGVKIALDVEGGIRALIDPRDTQYLAAAAPRGADPARLPGASAWIQPWLSDAAAGVYGNYWVHAGLRAPFYVLAAYPTSGDPLDASWWAQTPRPGALCGWQWHGSMAFAGMTIDLSWFDDALFTYLSGAAPKPPPPTPPQEEDDMLYVSSTFHALKATLKVFAAGSAYRDPSTTALATGPIGTGATIGVDGYVYSSSAVESSDVSPAAGKQPGPDKVWWHATSGQWVPDAYLDTSALQGAPSALPPASEAFDLYLARRSELVSPQGITLQQVDDEISKAVSSLQITRKPQGHE